MAVWVPLVSAVVAAVVAAIVGSIGGALASRRERKHDAAERTRLHVERYQEPLVRAAYELQSRLWNILSKQFFSEFDARTPAVQTYARQSTAWLFGQYFGWVEILRREAQFLRLPDADDRRQIEGALAAIAHACASDSAPLTDEFHMYRADQRALGELMIVEGRDSDGAPRRDCLGYAAFTEAINSGDSPLIAWFAPLFESVDGLVASPAHTARITTLQHALIDLIDAIDTDRSRFPIHREKVLSASVPSRAVSGLA